MSMPYPQRKVCTRPMRSESPPEYIVSAIQARAAMTTHRKTLTWSWPSSFVA